MVAFNYSKASLKAKALIEKFGAKASFVVAGNTGGYDDDGNVIPQTQDTTTSGTITPLLSYKSAEIYGTTIKSGDSYVFWDGSKPPIGAYVISDDQVWRAVNVTELKSVAGVSVYKKIQLRK